MAFPPASRVTAVVSLAAVSLFGPVVPAVGHSYLENSDPADGAELGHAPKRISLDFSDPLVPEGAGVTAAGPGGATRLEPHVSGDVISAPWPAGFDAGRYRVAYRAVALDGHVMTGTVSFRIAGNAAQDAAAAEPAPASPAPQADPAGTSPAPVPSWVWILGGAVVLTALAALLVTRASRGGE